MTDIPIKLQGAPGATAIKKTKPAFRIVTSPSRQVAPKAGPVSLTRIAPKPLTRIVPKSAAKGVAAPLPPPQKNLKLFPPNKAKHKPPNSSPFSSTRYEIIKVIHEGGFGTVFKAMDKMLKMDVAIKLLKHSSSQNQEALEQIKAEAAVTMKLSHEHIVRLHNIESEKGQLFIVMEYVDGQTLREIIEQMGALSLHTVLDITHSCVRALMYAHEQGVLHRDIKPENIMINQQMSLKLLDFGLAIKMSHGQDASDYIEGSPGYLSPEQLHGLPLDVRTDVFSLAAVVCELLTGQRAFPETARLKHMYDQDPVGIESLPAEVAQVIQWGLSRDMNARYNTPSEFYAALEQVIRPLIS
jgi:serine/threonine-protein kinase